MNKARIVLPLAGVLLVAGAAVSLGLPGPQQKAAGAPKSEIETWYVYKGPGDQRGYAHEKLTPRSPSGYDYLFEEDVYGLRTYHLSAVLDMNYFTQVIAGSRSVGGATTYLSSSADTEDPMSLRLDVIYPDSKRRAWSVSKSEEFYVNERVALYAMKDLGFPASGEKKTTRVLTWGEASVMEDMTFHFNNKVKREYEGEEKQVLYVLWDGVSGPVDLYVDAYGRVVEYANPDRSQFLFVSNGADARGKEAVLSDNGRRDPFRKDLAMEPQVSREHVSSSAKSGPLKQEDVSEAMMQAEQMLKDMQKLANDKKQMDVQKKYDEFMGAYQQLLQVLAAAKRAREITRLAELKKKADDFFPEGPERAYQEVVRVADQAAQAFDGGRCNDLAALNIQIVRMQADPRFLGSEYLVQVQDLQARIQRLQDRCANRKVLNDKKFEVSAVITYQEAQPYPVQFALDVMGQKLEIAETVFVTVPGAYAIVNTGSPAKSGESPFKVVRPGEALDSEITVKEIHPSSGNIPAAVVLSYKGETRDVYLRNPSDKKK